MRNWKLKSGIEGKAEAFAAEVVEHGDSHRFAKLIMSAPAMYSILVEIGEKSGFSGGRTVLKQAVRELLEFVG